MAFTRQYKGCIPIAQSYKVEEHEKIIQDQPGEIRQEKTVVVSQDEEGIKREVKPAQMSKPTRKSTAPRFVSPITGMIVDQGSDIVLEGIIDGMITLISSVSCYYISLPVNRVSLIFFRKTFVDVGLHCNL